MNEIQKIDFHGSKIAVIEKDGKQYVAMKPIVEAMGLAWKKQIELIKRDPVLSKASVTIPGIVAGDGKEREMFCLPINKLNGWLFKISASRYSGKRREMIIRYQEECYDVLYNYFHKGAAVNPAEDLAMVVNTLGQEIERRIFAEEALAVAVSAISELKPNCGFGEISHRTMEPRDIFIKATFRSRAKKHVPKVPHIIQMIFPFMFRREG